MENLGLETTTLAGHSILFYSHLNSTMDEAWRLAEESAQNGTVICAESQSQGRGRYKKQWESPAGGLYFSLILQSSSIKSEQPGLLTLAAAVALCRVIRNIYSIAAEIKWPNDVMLGDKKLAGILTEAKTQGNASVCVLGVGLNVKRPGGVEGYAFLDDEGGKSDAKRILESFLKEFDRLLGCEADGILSEWRKYNQILGKHVMMNEGDKTVEGIAQDIDTDGGLLLRIADGSVVKKISGEVSCVRETKE